MIIIIEHGWISTWSSQGIGPMVKMTIITMICFVIYILRWYEQFLPVHCSAGIGRSGTLCLVDSCLVMAEAGVQLSLALVCLFVKSFVMFGDESWHHENRHIVIFWEQQIVVVAKGSSYLLGAGNPSWHAQPTHGLDPGMMIFLCKKLSTSDFLDVWVVDIHTYSCQHLFSLSHVLDIFLSTLPVALYHMYIVVNI